jgi:hypothetical protein
MIVDPKNIIRLQEELKEAISYRKKTACQGSFIKRFIKELASATLDDRLYFCQIFQITGITDVNKAIAVYKYEQERLNT